MPHWIFADPAFLQHTPIHAARSIHIFIAHRKTRKALCREARVAPYPSNGTPFEGTRTRLIVNNMETGSSDESFGKLASDIRDYLKTCPESESNPLAYITLRNAGRLDLISRIMAAGGYIKVSKSLGIRVDESQFIHPPPTFTSSSETPNDTADDYNASLAIGRDLEERLNTIEEVMKNEGDMIDLSRRTVTGPVTDDVPTGEELRRTNETIRPAIVDEVIPFEERFTLTPDMRVGLLSLAVVSAIGLGRSSHEVVSENAISTCRSVTYGLLFAHFILAVYAGRILAPQKRRNASLWFLKVFVGGPLGLQYLRGLDVLPD